MTLGLVARRATTVAVFGLWVTFSSGCGQAGTSHSEDPCSPNPCKSSGKTVCTAADDKAVCSCDEGLGPDGHGGCASTKSWSVGIAGSAVAHDDPLTYAAHVRVIDGSGQPIKGVALRIGDHHVDTEADGKATFGGLALNRSANMLLSADGYVPATRAVSVASAGMAELVVELVPFGKVQKFAAAKRAELRAGPVMVSLAEQALVGAKGVRAQGDVLAHVAGFSPDAQSPRAWPGDQTARNAHGEPTLIKQWLGGVHVKFEDAQGAPLQLGPGSTATLRIAVPANSGVKNGDDVGLWSLDEATGHWMLESHCTVADAGAAKDKVQVCQGQVSHFSAWAAGVEWDVYSPGTVGCVNVTLEVKLPSGYKGNTRNISAMQCSGDTCAPSAPWYHGQNIFVPEDATHPHASLCGLADASAGMRFMVALDVENGQASMTPDPSALRDGTYVHMTDAVDFASFKDVLGSQVMLNQTFEPESDCRLLCKQVVITLDEKALRADGTFLDEDGDGFFTGSSDDASDKLAGQVDCKDDDALVYPGAFELPCGGIDYDCDGHAPDATKVTWHDVSDANLWNSRCGMACAAPDHAETAGNLYDEDCDGRVEDADRDGYDSYGDPADCDDLNPNAHPGGTEVAGNHADDDCDGVSLDDDNDGYFGWGQEFLALEQLGVDPEEHPEQFGDCNDHNAQVHPGVAVSEEVGQIAFLYRKQSDGGLERTEQFCDYFDDNGKPNSRLEALLIDRNCDGHVTDMDGDGWAAPGDDSLGPERAFDCNDLEPRVLPNAKPTKADDGSLIAPKCVQPKASELVNDSVCPVPDATTQGCSPLPIEGQSVQTSCWSVPNDQKLDISFCIYDGWDSGNPLKWKPGQAWGPCDGDVLLPACPEGYQCGGVQPYTDALESYLEQRYTKGAPVAYQGMCFALCSDGMSGP